MSSSSDGTARNRILSLFGGCFRTQQCHRKETSTCDEEPENRKKALKRRHWKIGCISSSEDVDADKYVKDEENERWQDSERVFKKTIKQRCSHLCRFFTTKSFAQALKDEGLLMCFSSKKHLVLKIAWMFTEKDLQNTRQVFYKSYRKSKWDIMMFAGVSDEMLASIDYDDYNEPIVDGVPSSVWLDMIEPAIPILVEISVRKRKRTNLSNLRFVHYLFDELITRHGDTSLVPQPGVVGPHQVLFNLIFNPPFPTTELGINVATVDSHTIERDREIQESFRSRKLRRRNRWTNKPRPPLSLSRQGWAPALALNPYPSSSVSSNDDISSTESSTTDLDTTSELSNPALSSSVIDSDEYSEDAECMDAGLGDIIAGSSGIPECSSQGEAARSGHVVRDLHSRCILGVDGEDTLREDDDAENHLEWMPYSFELGTGFSVHTSEIDAIFSVVHREDQVDMPREITDGVNADEDNEEDDIDDFVDNVVGNAKSVLNSTERTSENVPWETGAVDIIEAMEMSDDQSQSDTEAAYGIEITSTTERVFAHEHHNSEAGNVCLDTNNPMSYHDECVEDELAMIHANGSAYQLDEGIGYELAKLNMNQSARIHMHHDYKRIRCEYTPDTWVYDQYDRKFKPVRFRPKMSRVQLWQAVWSQYMQSYPDMPVCNTTVNRLMSSLSGKRGPFGRRFFVKQVTEMLNKIDGKDADAVHTVSNRKTCKPKHPQKRVSRQTKSPDKTKGGSPPVQDECKESKSPGVTTNVRKPTAAPKYGGMFTSSCNTKRQTPLQCCHQAALEMGKLHMPTEDRLYSEGRENTHKQDQSSSGREEGIDCQRSNNCINGEEKNSSGDIDISCTDDVLSERVSENEKGACVNVEEIHGPQACHADVKGQGGAETMNTSGTSVMYETPSGGQGSREKQIEEIECDDGFSSVEEHREVPLDMNGFDEKESCRRKTTPYPTTIKGVRKRRPPIHHQQKLQNDHLTPDVGNKPLIQMPTEVGRSEDELLCTRTESSDDEPDQHKRSVRRNATHKKRMPKTSCDDRSSSDISEPQDVEETVHHKEQRIQPRKHKSRPQQPASREAHGPLPNNNNHLQILADAWNNSKERPSVKMSKQNESAEDNRMPNRKQTPCPRKRRTEIASIQLGNGLVETSGRTLNDQLSDTKLPSPPVGAVSSQRFSFTEDESSCTSSSSFKSLNRDDASQPSAKHVVNFHENNYFENIDSDESSIIFTYEDMVELNKNISSEKDVFDTDCSSGYEKDTEGSSDSDVSAKDEFGSASRLPWRKAKIMVNNPKGEENGESISELDACSSESLCGLDGDGYIIVDISDTCYSGSVTSAASSENNAAISYRCAGNKTLDRVSISDCAHDISQLEDNKTNTKMHQSGNVDTDELRKSSDDSVDNKPTMKTNHKDEIVNSLEVSRGFGGRVGTFNYGDNGGSSEEESNQNTSSLVPIGKQNSARSKWIPKKPQSMSMHATTPTVPVSITMAIEKGAPDDPVSSSLPLVGVPRQTTPIQPNTSLSKSPEVTSNSCKRDMFVKLLEEPARRTMDVGDGLTSVDLVRRYRQARLQRGYLQYQWNGLIRLSEMFDFSLGQRVRRQSYRLRSWLDRHRRRFI